MYLVFPILAGCMYLRSRLQALLTGVALLAMLSILACTPTQSGLPMDFHDFFEPHTIMRGALGFMFGRVVINAERYPPFAFFISRSWVLLAIAATAIILLMQQGTESMILLIFPLLISALVHTKGIMAKQLNANWITLAGSLSYSVYLLHDQLHDVQLVIKRYFTLGQTSYDHSVYLLASFVFLYSISAFCYFLLETPARNYILKVWTRSGSQGTSVSKSINSYASANPNQ